MRTIQQRNLDRLSKTLNDGLSRLNELWGHGCPIGIDPIPFEDIFLSTDNGDHLSYCINHKPMVSIFPGDITRFLYDSHSIKPKLDWWRPNIKQVKRIQVMTKSLKDNNLNTH